MIRIDISEELFKQLIFTCMDYPDEPAFSSLQKLLEDKLDRMISREIYTKSKMAATAEEREIARQEYLNRKGVPDDFINYNLIQHEI